MGKCRDDEWACLEACLALVIRGDKLERARVGLSDEDSWDREGRLCSGEELAVEDEVLDPLRRPRDDDDGGLQEVVDVVVEGVVRNLRPLDVGTDTELEVEGW